MVALIWDSLAHPPVTHLWGKSTSISHPSAFPSCMNIRINEAPSGNIYNLATPVPGVTVTELYNSLSSGRTLWRNGSASDSRSEGCVFKSRQGQHFFPTLQWIPFFLLFFCSFFFYPPSYTFISYFSSLFLSLSFLSIFSSSFFVLSIR